MVGDEALRKQVNPIRALGQCSALVFDTDGSIFSAKMLKVIGKKPESDYKAIANIFAKRIALNAKPKPCHFCECEGHNSGTAYMTCMSCEHQGSLSDDYVSFWLLLKSSLLNLLCFQDVDETLEKDVDDSYEEE